MNDNGDEVLRGVETVGEVLAEYLDHGDRLKSTARGGRVRRFPTNSERLNRALVELRPSAFKVHTLIWKWRGAPSRGTLPFFTIRSLEKFCAMTRPTIRTALNELTSKGWVQRLGYNKHHKNTLYKLVAIRDVPGGDKKREEGKRF